MPEFNVIKVKNTYDNISKVKYNPKNMLKVLSEQVSESMQSIREVKRHQENDAGYHEDEEDDIPANPRTRTRMQRFKKIMEVTSSSQYMKCAKF